MTWDDDKPFPPWMLWRGLATFSYSAKWTDDDQADMSHRMRRQMYDVRNDMTDAQIMDALTRQAQRGVKPAARPFALWLEKDNDE